MAVLHCTSLYITLPWLYVTFVDSTLFYHESTSLYLTLLYCTIALLYSTWLYITRSPLALLHSISLHIILPRLYLTALDSTLLYYGSTLLYLTVHCSSVVVLYSAFFYLGCTSQKYPELCPVAPWCCLPEKIMSVIVTFTTDFECNHKMTGLVLLQENQHKIFYCRDLITPILNNHACCIFRNLCHDTCMCCAGSFTLGFIR